MKRKVIGIVVVCMLIIVLGVIVIALTQKESELRYDNETNLNDKITVTTPISEIDKIKQRMNTGNQPIDIDWVVSNTKIKIECMRKTEQGYYVVLKQDDGKLTFLFMDEEFEIETILTYAKFLSKDDFDFIVLLETRDSEIDEIGMNEVSYPVSAVSLSGYIVKEGILLIRYRRTTDKVDGVLVFESIVESVEFIDNEEILAFKKDDDMYFGNTWTIMCTPYIYPMDKNS